MGIARVTILEDYLLLEEFCCRFNIISLDHRAFQIAGTIFSGLYFLRGKGGFGLTVASLHLMDLKFIVCFP